MVAGQRCSALELGNLLAQRPEDFCSRWNGHGRPQAHFPTRNADRLRERTDELAGYLALGDRQWLFAEDLHEERATFARP